MYFRQLNSTGRLISSNQTARDGAFPPMKKRKAAYSHQLDTGRYLFFLQSNTNGPHIPSN